MIRHDAGPDRRLILARRTFRRALHSIAAELAALPVREREPPEVALARAIVILAGRLPEKVDDLRKIRRIERMFAAALFASLARSDDAAGIAAAHLAAATGRRLP